VLGFEKHLRVRQTRIQLGSRPERSSDRNQLVVLSILVSELSLGSDQRYSYIEDWVVVAEMVRCYSGSGADLEVMRCSRE
jgi:hypothetical protein